MAKPTTYKDAGVDIAAGNELVSRIGDIVKPTLRPEVMSNVGGFGALVSLADTPHDNPVLVSATDGVGTKLKLAFMADKHDTVGIDLVAMCVNDVIVSGAEPLFFLDYFATGKLELGVAESVIRGIAEGCKQANCSLVGGETAEMPGMYTEGEYDLAGFSVGIVERDEIIDGSSVRVGDKIVGLASSGVHSNGFSLVRKVLLEDSGLTLDETLPELDKPLGEELLTPTRIYVRAILNLKRDFSLNGIAHITGGGLPENLPRMLPNGVKAVIDRNSWTVPPIFSVIQKLGSVTEEDMLLTFNCGVGMAIIVPEAQAEEVIDRLDAFGERGWVIGTVETMKEGDKAVEING
jgi:phosphoribosylformylglycinamidine cyclo-ligase